MKTKILAILLLITGCTSARFNSVIGEQKQVVLEVLGPPTQVVKTQNNSEIWVYPTSRNSSSGLPLEDDDSIGDAFRKGVAEGVAQSVLDTIFVPGGPYRYLTIGPDGRAVSWETRTFTRRAP